MTGAGRQGLVLDGVEAVYGGLAPVLDGISLHVDPGEVVAVLGPNGAGKTTMLRAISGLLAPDRGRVSCGTIHWEGTRLSGLDPADIVRRGVVQVLEGRHVFRHLTVEQNLLVGGHVRSSMVQARGQLAGMYDLFPPLARLRRSRAGDLSGGEQQMLAIARALMADPRLLVLDEPSLGLAPIKVREVLEMVVMANRNRGVTVLLVEQNAHAALSVASRAYVLDGGRIVLSGTADELRADPEVSHSYLGVGAGGGAQYREIAPSERRPLWFGSGRH